MTWCAGAGVEPRPYRARVAAVVGLIVVTSTIGIVNPLLIQAVRHHEPQPA